MDVQGTETIFAADQPPLHADLRQARPGRLLPLRQHRAAAAFHLSAPDAAGNDQAGGGRRESCGRKPPGCFDPEPVRPFSHQLGRTWSSCRTRTRNPRRRWSSAPRSASSRTTSRRPIHAYVLPPNFRRNLHRQGFAGPAQVDAKRPGPLDAGDADADRERGNVHLRPVLPPQGAGERAGLCDDRQGHQVAGRFPAARRV